MGQRLGEGERGAFGLAEVLAFTVVDGRIKAIDALQGPTRLAGLGLEAFVPDP
jgi:hypothetical protein